MERREFLKMAAVGMIGSATLGVVGCGGNEAAAPAETETNAAPQAEVMPAEELAEEVQQDSALPELDWQMATSWPVALDTIPHTHNLECTPATAKWLRKRPSYLLWEYTIENAPQLYW